MTRYIKYPLLENHDMMMYGVMEVIYALDDGEWSALIPGRFSRGGGDIPYLMHTILCGIQKFSAR
jgi:hypothetical protein